LGQILTVSSSHSEGLQYPADGRGC